MKWWQRPYAQFLRWRMSDLREKIRDLTADISGHEADIRRLELIRESVYGRLCAVDSKLEKLEK